MNRIWLQIGLYLLSKLSGPAQEYMVAGFDWLDEKAKGTVNVIDDWIVKGLRIIFIGGQYQSAGTGKAEEMIAAMINKLSPAVRLEFYNLLQLGLAGAESNTIVGDEVAMKFMISVIFPDGAPCQGPPADLYPETSTAPGTVAAGRD